MNTSSFFSTSRLAIQLAGSALPNWEQTLRSGAWFASLSIDLQNELLSAADARKLRAGQFAFYRGDPANGVYAVLVGSLHVLSTTGSGGERRETLLQVLSQSDWFGETALFDDAPRDHYVQAASDSCLLQWDKNMLEPLLARQPALLRHFGQLVTHRARVSLQTVQEMTTQPVHTRLAGRLMDVATGSRWRAYAAAVKPGTTVGLMQTELASMLGCSRQTVNRMLAAMQNRGWLLIRRAEIEILDPLALERHAHGLGSAAFH
jgi:CRP/FNR family transcriptional regulator, cyclic AMP receptor protein